MNEFTARVVEVLLQVPKGYVVTYGQVAAMAGNPRGARQVVRILNTQTTKHGLPWHRVINSKGKIALTDPDGIDFQKSLLISEGIKISETLKIDLTKYQWMRSDDP